VIKGGVWGVVKKWGRKGGGGENERKVGGDWGGEGDCEKGVGGWGWS